MSDPRIVALDLSLRSTGYAAADDGELRVGRIRPPAVPENLAGLALLHATCKRLDWIRADVQGLIEATDLVVIEGYSYGTRNHRAESIGELGGVVRLVLWEAGIPTVIISPSELKKYATGNGGVGKEAVLVAAVRRFSQEFTNDTADARWLLDMALAHYGLPHVPMPKTHTAVLDKIDWPALRVPEEARP